MALAFDTTAVDDDWAMMVSVRFFVSLTEFSSDVLHCRDWGFPTHLVVLAMQ